MFFHFRNACSEDLLNIFELVSYGAQVWDFSPTFRNYKFSIFSTFVIVANSIHLTKDPNNLTHYKISDPKTDLVNFLDDDPCISAAAFVSLMEYKSEIGVSKTEIDQYFQDRTKKIKGRNAYMKGVSKDLVVNVKLMCNEDMDDIKDRVENFVKLEIYRTILIEITMGNFSNAFFRNFFSHQLYFVPKFLHCFT